MAGVEFLGFEVLPGGRFDHLAAQQIVDKRLRLRGLRPVMAVDPHAGRLNRGDVLSQKRELFLKIHIRCFFARPPV